VTAPDAFDQIAGGYDGRFTQSAIGRRMRRAVWRRCDALFPPGARLLEINCGTGEDAVHLGARGVRVLATDASAAMLAIAREKARTAGVAGAVQFEQLRIEDVGPSLGTFDGVLSNFGGLNCVADLGSVAAGLASVLRRGGLALLCVMGPWVPWEWAWFALRGDPARAVRRLRRGGTPWRGLVIHYPSIAAVRRAFRPSFRVRRVGALCVLCPPPFADGWASRHPRLVDTLDRVERTVETAWPFPWLADHYVIELERTPA